MENLEIGLVGLLTIDYCMTTESITSLFDERVAVYLSSLNGSFTILMHEKTLQSQNVYCL